MSTIVLRPEFRGNIARLFSCRQAEVIIDGPAGTGKSVGVWNKLHACLHRYPRARILALRKTLTDLTTSGIVTFERQVLHELDGVEWFGGSQREPASYRYPNGSRLVVGGLDRATKVLSSEYDIIYIQECTEVDEGEWELCSSRLRNGVIPYQQILGDCNPDAPTHWIKQRAAAGKLALLPTTHEDNPRYWDATTNQPTEAGRAYLARLDALTGVRYLRYRKGLWVSAEGQVFEEFDPSLHLISRDRLPENAFRDWSRIWVIDFGFTNPFVWQEWLQSPDGEIYLNREIYKTQTLVEDHARAILAETGRAMLYDANGKPTGTLVEIREDPSPLPQVLICDHDAEDRATLIRHLGIGNIAAKKSISDGIQAFAARLKPTERSDGEKRPMAYLLQDTLIHPPDGWLLDHKAPTCTADEFGGYVWNDRAKKEQPVDKDNHGMDCCRYIANFLSAGIRIATSSPYRQSLPDLNRDAETNPGSFDENNFFIPPKVPQRLRR
jgi:phage terminase large subunit